MYNILRLCPIQTVGPSGGIRMRAAVFPRNKNATRMQVVHLPPFGDIIRIPTLRYHRTHPMHLQPGRLQAWIKAPHRPPHPALGYRNRTLIYAMTNSRLKDQ